MKERAPGSASAPHSIADIVLDPQAYSALLTSTRTNTSPHPTHDARPEQSARAPYHPSRVVNNSLHRSPPVSITDLVLDNVTYDKILSSSAKDFGISERTSPAPVDALTPPNSPTSDPGQQSLAGLSAIIMTSDPSTATTSGQNKTGV